MVESMSAPQNLRRDINHYQRFPMLATPVHKHYAGISHLVEFD